jgi:hypothetical protein
MLPMHLMPATETRAMPAWRAAWRCSDLGFVAVLPLSACRTVAAAGTATPSRPDMVETRARMREVVNDAALLEGHDPWTLLHRANAALSRRGLGRLHTVALLSRAGDGAPLSVTAAGSPAPLVATSDGLTVPVGLGAPLAAGWTLVLGTEDETAGPGRSLLAPGDVQAARSLLRQPAVQTAPLHRRTLVALVAA